MKTESSTPESGANGHGGGPAPSRSAAAEAALSGVSREFHNFVADIEDLIKATTSLTGDDLARAKVTLSERMAAAKESFGEVGGEIAQRARKTAGMTNSYVHEQPWTAICVGTAAGFLLGFVLARRV